MNEADRTELERLIAAARPAGPSEHLDGRVRDALIGDAIPQSIRRERKPDRIRWLAIAASALIAAGVGFVGGRLTAGDDASRTVPAAPLSSVETSDLAERRDSNSTTPSLVAAQTTVIPLSDERLAGLFVTARSREGLLGAGPVKVDVSDVP